MSSAKQSLLLKILCVLGFIYALVFHIHLHTACESVESQKTLTWKQPATVNQNYPEPITNKGARFNYAAIEKIIWQFSFTEEGKIVVDPSTSKQFKLICSHVNQEILNIKTPSEELQRIKFLIQQSVSGQLSDNGSHKAGLEFADMLMNICEYFKVHGIRVAKASMAKGNEKLDLLKAFVPDAEALQKKLLGAAVADKLFAGENATLRYFNQRQIINLRDDLTPAEKKAELAKLQDVYKKALDELEQ